MPEIIDIIDHSRPARKRDPLTPSPFEPRESNGHSREDRVPAVDWTGHEYKAPRDLRVTDYGHVGRCSSARG